MAVPVSSAITFPGMIKMTVQMYGKSLSKTIRQK